MSPGNTRWFGIDGRAEDPNDITDTLYRVGTNDYLKTLGVQVVDGRLLDERDGADTAAAVVINETFARKYWPGTSPIGSRMRIADPNGPHYTIVGVVRDVHERGYTLAMKPAVYVSVAQKMGAFPEYRITWSCEPPRTRTSWPARSGASSPAWIRISRSPPCARWTILSISTLPIGSSR